MASVLVHTAEENVTLSAQAAKKLLERSFPLKSLK